MSLSTSNMYKIQCNDHQTLTMTVITIEDHVNDLYTNQLLDFYICNDDFIIKVLLETNVVIDSISTTESSHVEEEEQQQTQHNITVAYLLQSNPKQQLMC